MPKITGPSRGIKHEGSLTKLGYKEHEPTKTRHRALGKSVRKFGYKRTTDKLIDLQVLNKNRNPEFSHVVKSDRSWLRGTYRPSSVRNR
jgi:hypothetical protein